MSEWVNKWMNEWISEWVNEWMVEWQPMHLFSCKCSKTNNFSLLFCGKFWPPLICDHRACMSTYTHTHRGTHHVIIMWRLSAGALTDSPTFGPNLNEFVKRFDSSKTKGQGTHLHTTVTWKSRDSYQVRFGWRIFISLTLWCWRPLQRLRGCGLITCSILGVVRKRKWLIKLFKN